MSPSLIPITTHLSRWDCEARCYLMSSARWDAELSVVSATILRFAFFMSQIWLNEGPGSDQYQLLSNATKPEICDILLGTVPKTIETIQALNVNAGYSEKGWLLTSMAAKMALDLNLPDSYMKLIELSINTNNFSETEKTSLEDETLLRESRVWFQTFVLENILSIDCGKKPGIRSTSAASVRRCRVLLGHPSRTTLDFRLLSQVEVYFPISLEGTNANHMWRSMQFEVGYLTKSSYECWGQSLYWCSTKHLLTKD